MHQIQHYFFYIPQSLETLDNGKTLTDAREDVSASIAVFKYFAGWSDKVCGKTIPVGAFLT